MAYAVLRHTTGVAFVRSISGTLVLSSGQLQLPDGTASDPSLTYSADPDTGWYRYGTNTMAATLGGTALMGLNASGFMNLTSSGSLGWTSSSTDPFGTRDLILARGAANTLIQRNGTATQAFQIGPSGSYIEIAKSNGGVGQIYTRDAFALQLGANNALQWAVSSSGHLLALTDNTYDIGASGATRPRYLYISQDGVFGGGIYTGQSQVHGWSGWGGFTGIADGQIDAKNNAGTAGVRLDYANNDGVLHVSARATGADTATVRTSKFLARKDGGAASMQWQNAGTGSGASDGMLAGHTASDGVNFEFWNFENGFIRFGVNNATTLTLNAAGSATFVGAVAAASASGDFFQAASTGYFKWASRSSLYAPGDGLVQLFNHAETGFTRLILGTNDTNGASIVKNGSDLQFKNGSAAGYCSVEALAYGFSSAALDIGTGTGDPEGVRTRNVGSLYLRTDGGAGTTLYIKQSGTGNTGWAAVTP